MTNLSGYILLLHPWLGDRPDAISSGPWVSSPRINPMVQDVPRIQTRILADLQQRLASIAPSLEIVLFRSLDQAENYIQREPPTFVVMVLPERHLAVPLPVPCSSDLTSSGLASNLTLECSPLPHPVNAATPPAVLRVLEQWRQMMGRRLISGDLLIVALSDEDSPRWLHPQDNPGFDGFLVYPIDERILSNLLEMSQIRRICQPYLRNENGQSLCPEFAGPRLTDPTEIPGR